MERVYVYVDGESHFIRAREACKRVFGQDVELQDLKPYSNRGRPPLVKSECKFYWHRDPDDVVTFARQVYFTSAVGDDGQLSEYRIWIRDHDFEPEVIKEAKTLAKRRESDLKDFQIIEKPKGVDITLATRMLEDATLDNYDGCRLYTSDADYLPVIKAVRRMGKTVKVFGSRQGIAADSPLLYVPDLFADCGDQYFKEHFVKKPTS
jgi:NYN domain